MKSLKNWIVFLMLLIPSLAYSKPSTFLTSPDTICIDTATVKKWANDKVVLKNQVSFLTEELTETKAGEQLCKLERNNLIDELELQRRSKASNYFLGGLVGLVLGLLI